MAGLDYKKEDGGRRTRFPCLVTVRYTVAAVVSVLTLVVVGLVSAIALRPHRVIFSVALTRQLTGGNGSSVTTTTVPELSVGVGGHAGLPSSSSSSSKRAEMILGVRLTAENPNGRGDIEDIRNITIVVLYTYPPYYRRFSLENLTEITSLDLQEEHFPLTRQSSHTLSRTAPVVDARNRRYLRSLRSFVAVVQVNATIVSGNHVTRTANVTHYCWPVIVSVGYDARATSCRPSQEMESPVSYSKLPPPPPPPGPAPVVPPAA